MSKPLKTIVIGTSLTDGSDGVVKTGVALARAAGAAAWLVHVCPPYLPLALPTGAGVELGWLEDQMKTLRKQAFEQARRTGLSALAGFAPERVKLRVGTPHRELVELARRVKADLIVVGTAEAPHVLGSTAERVIRKAPCPVLAVREEAAFPPHRVEIAVDLSPSSANALRQGLAFLERLGTPLPETEVLFVLNPYEVGGSIHFKPEQIERFAGEELRRFLAANAPEGARKCPTRVRHGYARPEILAAIAERQADLAVLGTHGLGGFERLVIGSIAAGVLRAAPCNLLVVPPPAGQEEEAAAEWAGADWTYVSDEVAAGTATR